MIPETNAVETVQNRSELGGNQTETDSVPSVTQDRRSPFERHVPEEPRPATVHENVAETIAERRERKRQAPNRHPGEAPSAERRSRDQDRYVAGAERVSVHCESVPGTVGYLDRQGGAQNNHRGGLSEQ